MRSRLEYCKYRFPSLRNLCIFLVHSLFRLFHLHLLFVDDVSQISYRDLRLGRPGADTFERLGRLGTEMTDTFQRIGTETTDTFTRIGRLGAETCMCSIFCKQIPLF